MNNNQTKEQKLADKLKFWKLSRGAHKLKNRSSKNILRLGHYNPNKIWTQLSNAALQEIAKNSCFDAEQELNRRSKKRAKKQHSA